MKILLTLSMFLVFNSAIASISTVNSGEPISAIKINQIIDQVNSIPESPTYTYPTITKFTSGSGTYTLPANVKYIIVSVVGGGGGGEGSASVYGGGGGDGGAGGTSSFGTNLIIANGGAGGSYAGVINGGSYTINSPALQITATDGGNGQTAGFWSQNNINLNQYMVGGMGGSSCMGGAGSGPVDAAGSSAKANSGSGGGGGGTGTVGSSASSSKNPGSGGGAGSCTRSMITAPIASYSYSVGASGTAGAAGSGGYAGGLGGSGYIVIEEYYQ